MPFSKYAKGKCGEPGAQGGDRCKENRDPNFAYCCTPKECCKPNDSIDIKNPGKVIKVYCNNEQCTYGEWMHAECFDEWEETVLAFLRSCGRARSWSEKQRLQNLWTKKGYDLAFKACDCRCGKGHLRKDLDYYAMAPRNVETEEKVDKKLKKHKKKNDKPVAVMSRGPPVGYPVPQDTKPQLRLRTCSISSTGSSPPRSESPPSSSTPPTTPETPIGLFVDKSKFSFMLNTIPSNTGNIFQCRSDLSAFKCLPIHKRNPYHIRMEEDSNGNDEIRCFILSSLSMNQIANVPCVVCGLSLPVFDHYPLIDGTFFLSPMRYNSSIQVKHDGKTQFINAACMSCLEGGRDICCRNCRSRWDGKMLQLGTMYTYDIFAATPCCQKRLSCKKCGQYIVDISKGLQFFSEYSHSIECPRCKTAGYHFVKPLSHIFYIKKPIY